MVKSYAVDQTKSLASRALAALAASGPDWEGKKRLESELFLDFLPVTDVLCYIVYFNGDRG